MLIDDYDIISEANFIVNSGPVYKMQKKTDKTAIYYGYAKQKQSDSICHLSYETEQKETINQCPYLRHHKSLAISHRDNYQYHLFEYYGKESISLAQIIRESEVQKYSIRKDVILLYLSQLLEALQVLHSVGLIGRVFSTQNIIETGKGLVMMDFGFFSELTSPDSLIVAPPEIITADSRTYDETIDVWLLGAVLYHLIKLMPVCKYKYNQEAVHQSSLLKSMHNSRSVEVKTTRYDEQLTQLVESMLMYNSKSRINFQAIWSHPLLKDHPKQQEMIQFYRIQFNSLIGTIHNRIKCKDLNLQHSFKGNELSGSLMNPDICLYSYNNQINQKQVEDLKNPLQTITVGASDLTAPRPILDLLDFKSTEQDPTLKKIWCQLNFELYKLFNLTETIGLAWRLDKNQEIHIITAYFLNQMRLLIIAQLLTKINEQDQQSIEIWQKFQDSESKRLLQYKLIELQQQLIISQTELYNKALQYVDSPNLDELIRQYLRQEQNYHFQQPFSGYELATFLQSSYRSVTGALYQSFSRKFNIAKDEDKCILTKMILKILFCHLINRIFDGTEMLCNFTVIKGTTFEDVQQVDQFVEQGEQNDKLILITQLVKRYFNNCQ